MASGWRGVAAGGLALIAVETLVQPSAAGRVGGLFALPGSWAKKFLDPAVPAFHVGASSSSGSSKPPPPPPDKNLPYTNPGGGAGSSGSDLLPQLLPSQGQHGNPTSSGGTGPIYST